MACTMSTVSFNKAMQAQVAAAFTNPARWAYKAILNVARVGTFSSDRTIRQYAKDIWQIAQHTRGEQCQVTPFIT